MTNLIALAPGTVLTGGFRIERVLGAGGFGVTYLAEQIALSRAVTIKEYFPSDFAARANGIDCAPRSADCASDFQWGLDRFVDEAQTLAKLDHPNIVRVYDYFRANGTGYMVLQFEEGQSLKSWLKSLGRAPRQAELDTIVKPLLDALEFIHKADYLHRDVAPDNIIIRRDGVPVLIDFGSAREAIIARSKTVSALVKPGYSPYEQYAETGKQQGPWSDIYALAATLYHAVTGRRPPDSPSRMLKDEYVSARAAAVGGFRARFLEAIDRGLALHVEARPQSIAAWRGDLLAPDAPKQSWFSRGKPAKRDEDGLAQLGANGPVQAGAASPLVPPVPDAPGPQGGLLDFVDRLKGPDGNPQAQQPAQQAQPAQSPAPNGKPEKPAPPAKGSAKPAEAAAAKSPPKRGAKAAPAAAKPQPAKSAAKKAPPKLAEAPPSKKAGTAVDRGAPQRPRPVRTTSSGGSFGLALKIAVAAGLAGTVLAYQDRLFPSSSRPAGPSAGTTGATGSAGSTGASTASAPAKVEAPQLLREIRAHPSDVVGLAVSEDGRSIVSVSRGDASLKVWSLSTGALLRTIALDNRQVSSLALSGRRVAIGHTDGTVTLYDFERGERLAAFKRNDVEVWSVAFLGSGDRFAAASHDYKTAVWEVANPAQPKFVLEGHESAAQAVAYSVHGPWIATGSADKTVRLYEADTQDHIRTYRGTKDFVTALTFSPDGKTLAAATLDGDIRLYQTNANRQRVSPIDAHRGRIAALAYSANGEYLASAGDDGTVKIWTGTRGRSVLVLPGQHTGGAMAVAFAPAEGGPRSSGKRLVAAGADGMIRVWQLPASRRTDDE